MKNFILKLLTLIFAITLCLGLFTACGDDSHVHNYKTFKFNAENHWYECSCGDKQTVEKHKGGIATITNKAICEVCNQEYGELLSENHVHEYANLNYDANSHWYECSCGLKENIEGHKGGIATTTQKPVCEICGQQYGSFLEHQHNFNKTITSSTYLKEKATCKSKAEFYFSCECGEKGESTFTYGDFGTHNLNNGKCSACEEQIFTTDGTYIYFGKYPQTIKANSVSITSSIPNEKGYYLGSDGEEYAMVSGFPYVMETNKKVFKFSDNTDIVSGQTYYFKVEPIKWRILNIENGNLLLLCDLAIDRGAYNNSSSINNYKNSSIRNWLNNEFYNKSFKNIEESIINTVNVDNSAKSTGYNNNKCACDNTLDKVFLLSYMDATNASYGFNNNASRELSTSDYARARGANLYPYNNYGVYNAHWLTRSPETESDGVRMVNPNGGISWVHISDSHASIIPAIQIKVGENFNINQPNNKTEESSLYVRDVDYIYFGKYPQSIKASSVNIISETPNANGYYLGDDNCEYVKTGAFPYESGYKFSNGSIIQNSVEYYFKVEPIKWRILKENSSEALLVSNSILQGYKFDQRTTCTYYKSVIRAHVTLDYYEELFTANEQEIILTTTVDNSVISTGYLENSNVCDNTEDKVFLLSYAEATSSNLGFSAESEHVLRKKIATDYARASGVCINTSSDYYGYGNWWLRSMSNATTFGVRIVNYYGGFSFGNCYDVGGLVPAMRIKL